MMKLKLQKIIIFVLAFSTLGALLALEGNYATSYSLTDGKYVEIPARKIKFPFYVYGSESGDLSDFVASGYMGDTQSLKTVASAYDPTAPASTGRTGKTTLRIDYKPMGRQGWAGIYWQSPANNWGKIKGAGFNLAGAKYLSFWAHGEKGGEILAAAKVGGIVGPYPDSDSVVMGPITLTKEWKNYKIDVTGKDLRHIIGGFAFQIRRADNPMGATFYFDEIVFNGDAELDYAFGSGVEAKVPQVADLPKRKVANNSDDDDSSKAPRVIYIEKPVYISQGGGAPQEKPIEMEPFKPGFWDFFFDILRRAMEIQPSGYGYDVPLYMWAKHIEKTWVPHPKEEISPVASTVVPVTEVPKK